MSSDSRFDTEEVEKGDVAGKTTIMFGNLDPQTGALIVDAYEDTQWVLSREKIAEAIKAYGKGNLQTTVQAEPFWTQVDSRHRLVFRLEVPNWYFPCMKDMQQGKLPFKMVSEDPQDDYKRPQIMSERNIWPEKQKGNKRIKTCYVDYTGTWQTIPFVFDLNAYVWQDANDENSFRTPIIIDPGSGGGRGTP